MTTLSRLISLLSVSDLRPNIFPSSVPCSAAAPWPLWNWTLDLWLTAAGDDVTLRRPDVMIQRHLEAVGGVSAFLKTLRRDSNVWLKPWIGRGKKSFWIVKNKDIFLSLKHFFKAEQLNVEENRILSSWAWQTFLWWTQTGLQHHHRIKSWNIPLRTKLTGDFRIEEKSLNYYSRSIRRDLRPCLHLTLNIKCVLSDSRWHPSILHINTVFSDSLISELTVPLFIPTAHEMIKCMGACPHRASIVWRLKFITLISKS